MHMATWEHNSVIRICPPMETPETRACSLGQEGTPEGMTASSRILAWESHGQWSLLGYTVCRCKESDLTYDRAGMHKCVYIHIMYIFIIYILYIIYKCIYVYYIYLYIHIYDGSFYMGKDPNLYIIPMTWFSLKLFCRLHSLSAKCSIIYMDHSVTSFLSTFLL